MVIVEGRERSGQGVGVSAEGQSEPLVPEPAGKVEEGWLVAGVVRCFPKTRPVRARTHDPGCAERRDPGRLRKEGGEDEVRIDKVQRDGESEDLGGIDHRPGGPGHPSIRPVLNGRQVIFGSKGKDLLSSNILQVGQPGQRSNLEPSEAATVRDRAVQQEFRRHVQPHIR